MLVRGLAYERTVCVAYGPLIHNDCRVLLSSMTRSSIIPPSSYGGVRVAYAHATKISQLGDYGFSALPITFFGAIVAVEKAEKINRIMQWSLSVCSLPDSSNLCKCFQSTDVHWIGSQLHNTLNSHMMARLHESLLAYNQTQRKLQFKPGCSREAFSCCQVGHKALHEFPRAASHFRSISRHFLPFCLFFMLTTPDAADFIDCLCPSSSFETGM